MSVFISALAGRAKDLNIKLTAEQLEQCEKYYRLVTKANESLNLTRITDEEQAAERHYADAMIIANALYIKKGSAVIDIGTGAGFPGVPLLILRPDLHITLLDSSGKKTDFLRGALESLNFTADVVCGRAEEIARTSFRGSFDVALSRAVAPLAILLELSVPLLRVGGVLCAFKGESYKREIDDSAFNALSCSLIKSVSAGRGTLLLIKKQKPTPDFYPRRYSKIKNSPL
ncbi:MAG: 16S rRNA (guanine(527)-N(7))-methyltransferase RsmG [Christensenellales bacterium]